MANDVGLMPELLTSLPGPLKRAVLAPLTPKELLNCCLVSLAWKEIIYGDAALRKVLKDEEDKHNLEADEAASLLESALGFGPESRLGMSTVDQGCGRRLLATKKKQLLTTQKQTE